MYIIGTKGAGSNGIGLFLLSVIVMMNFRWQFCSGLKKPYVKAYSALFLKPNFLIHNIFQVFNLFFIVLVILNNFTDVEFHYSYFL